MKGIKRERKGSKGISTSNYVRSMLGATTEYTGGFVEIMS